VLHTEAGRAPAKVDMKKKSFVNKSLSLCFTIVGNDSLFLRVEPRTSALGPFGGVTDALGPGRHGGRGAHPETRERAPPRSRRGVRKRIVVCGELRRRTNARDGDVFFKNLHPSFFRVRPITKITT
jgi:hypothetical protein